MSFPLLILDFFFCFFLLLSPSLFSSLPAQKFYLFMSFTLFFFLFLFGFSHFLFFFSLSLSLFPSSYTLSFFPSKISLLSFFFSPPRHFFFIIIFYDGVPYLHYLIFSLLFLILSYLTTF